eukprot:5698236-Pleurochrysis_carterae.AAC.1
MIGCPQSAEPIQPVQPCTRLSQVRAHPGPRALLARAVRPLTRHQRCCARKGLHPRPSSAA